MRGHLVLLASLLAVACAESGGTNDPVWPDSAVKDAIVPIDSEPTPDSAEPDSQVPDAAPRCPDLDRDGYQDKTCNANVASNGGDCDDSNNLINPGRAENCGTPIDDDCDGKINQDDRQDCAGPCADLDADGFEDATCNADRTTGGDCNDQDPRVNPGATEVPNNLRDDDCQDGDGKLLPNCTDNDFDGFGEGSGCFGPDCNDNDARINPWRSDVCGDGIDQDCTGLDLQCLSDCTDRDKDGFGNGTGCYLFDCNDNDPTINPGARDIPGDDIDQDCDNHVLVLSPDCLDRDQDGYGQGRGCLQQDCDDTNPRIHRDRREICGNGIDDDCVGGDQPCTHPGTGECLDRDGDGYGNGGCPNGGPDCDDNDRTVNPGAPEICNGKDDNCNAQIDECPLRNQICDGDACIGQVGSPCQQDDDCAASLGLACNEESGECRVVDGQTCAQDAQCNPGAECILLDVCDPEAERCYQAKGGPCASDCDCTDMWLCNDTNQRCVECVGDFGCNQDSDRDTCTDGGFCTQMLPIGGPELDSRRDVFFAIIDCWNSFNGASEPQGCATLDVDAQLYGDDGAGNLVRIPSIGDDDRFASSLDDYACNSDYLNAAGFDSSNQSVLAEVFGCGVFDLDNIYWSSVVTPNTTGSTCIYYVPNQSGFDLPSRIRPAIVLSTCDVSAFE